MKLRSNRALVCKECFRSHLLSREMSVHATTSAYKCCWEGAQPCHLLHGFHAKRSDLGKPTCLEGSTESLPGKDKSVKNNLYSSNSILGPLFAYMQKFIRDLSLLQISPGQLQCKGPLLLILPVLWTVTGRRHHPVAMYLTHLGSCSWVSSPEVLNHTRTSSAAVSRRWVNQMGHIQRTESTYH